MGKVVTGGTVSLDGFVAGANDSDMGLLFAWFDGGDHEFPSVDPAFHKRPTAVFVKLLGQRG